MAKVKTIKIQQSKVDAVVKEWLRFVMAQPFKARFKFCWTIMSRKGMSH